MTIEIVQKELDLVWYYLYSHEGHKLGTVKHSKRYNDAYFISNEACENRLADMRKVVQFMESITL